MRLTLLFSFVFAVLMTVLPLQEAKSDALMDCMTQCIQHEGGNSATNKATCKNRCGAKMLNQQPQQSGMKDCMGQFKECSAACGKEKIGQPSPCHKQCKARLRTCT